MNALKLKQYLSEFSDESLESLNLTVQTFGGMRGNNVSVETANVGFDWERGQLVLTPKTALTFYKKMNNFKFRFWSKKENRFIQTVVKSGGGICYDYYIYISQWGGLIAMNQFGQLDPIIDAIKLDDDDFVIQQYTTYKDKNLREIYVGDIIKGNLPEDGSELIAPVAFSPMLGYQLNSRLNTSHGIMYDCNLHIGDKVEVIGNIFENSDLIIKEDLIHE